MFKSSTFCLPLFPLKRENRFQLYKNSLIEVNLDVSRVKFGRIKPAIFFTTYCSSFSDCVYKV